jgi:hypothetical protein
MHSLACRAPCTRSPAAPHALARLPRPTHSLACRAPRTRSPAHVRRALAHSPHLPHTTLATPAQRLTVRRLATEPPPLRPPPPPAGRELFALTGEALRDNLDPVLKVLAQAITEPKLVRWEVAEGKAAMGGVIHDLEADATTTLMEGVHSAAYGATSPLGHSRYAAEEDLADVDDVALRSFLAARVKGNNIVVVGNSQSTGWEGGGGAPAYVHARSHTPCGESRHCVSGQL